LIQSWIQGVVNLQNLKPMKKTQDELSFLVITGCVRFYQPEYIPGVLSIVAISQMLLFTCQLSVYGKEEDLSEWYTDVIYF